MKVDDILRVPPFRGARCATGTARAPIRPARAITGAKRPAFVETINSKTLFHAGAWVAGKFQLAASNVPVACAMRGRPGRRIDPHHMTLLTLEQAAVLAREIGSTAPRSGQQTWQRFSSIGTVNLHGVYRA